MRTGKPCSRGSASPFMPMAMSASRPSRATLSGTEMVMPSTSVHRIWSAAGRVDAGPVEDVLEGYAEPAGGADVGAADVVGDAGQGDVALDEPHLGEVVERQLDLLVDVAVDGQRPRVDVDGRDRERGVDAVEVGVGRTERRDARDPLLEAGGQGGRPCRRRRAGRCRCRAGGPRITQRPAPAMAAAASAAPPVAIRTVRRDADVVVGSPWSPAVVALGPRRPWRRTGRPPARVPGPRTGAAPTG